MKNSKIIKNKIYEFLDVDFCGSCGAPNLSQIYNFGKVSLAGNFPLGSEVTEKFFIPMKLLACEKCELVQITPNVADSLLFLDYRYVSSIGMQSHFNEFAEWFFTKQYGNSTLKILEIGSNDGPLLQALKRKGFNPVGIDPAINIAKLAQDKGLAVITDYFDESALDKYGLRNSQDVVIACNSFAHISDISGIASAVSSSLKPSGIFIVEVQSLVALNRTNSFDFIYHEHKYYYTLKSISNLLYQFGLNLIDGIKINTHGGSYRLVFSKESKDKSKHLQEIELQDSSTQSIKSDLQIGIDNFFNQIELTRNFLRKCQQEGKLVIGIGASGRANMLLQYLGEDAKIIDMVLDESPERIGRRMGFTGIPIRALSEISSTQYDVVLILAWNYASEISLKIPKTNRPTIVPLPTFQELIR